MLKTTANKITLLRVVLIPVFLILAYRGKMIAALLIYLLACLSDTADGYIARHYNQVTNFGKFMDPLADKVLVLAAMCFFAEKGQMPGWAVAVVLFREFAVSGLRHQEESVDGAVLGQHSGCHLRTFECRSRR